MPFLVRVDLIPVTKCEFEGAKRGGPDVVDWSRDREVLGLTAFMARPDQVRDVLDVMGQRFRRDLTGER